MTTHKEARSSFRYHLVMGRRDGLQVYVSWLSSATQSRCNMFCHVNLLVHNFALTFPKRVQQDADVTPVSLRQRPQIGRTYWTTTTTDNKARIPTMLLAKHMEGRK